MLEEEEAEGLGEYVAYEKGKRDWNGFWKLLKYRVFGNSTEMLTQQPQNQASVARRGRP